MERGLRVVRAEPSQASELAEVAARTFPLACPPSVGPQDVEAFVAENLSRSRFEAYLADPDRTVLIAVADDRILGYAMMLRGVPDDPDVSRAVAARPSVELSKMYVVPESHGGGVSAALMNAVLDQAGTLAAASVWLGVNQRNARAQRFYAKFGFAITGSKTFRLGEHVEADYVMVRPV
ncbi:GNAT family N-acetyltransferase [Mycolicibacterium sp. BiH015]|uniref:GNAT family N-acetyltransferase n=1 Tax=Mycolicibacterium sp. BiH015 TaxID=3018808 RepID=UPI0022E05B14|nr:GNAT family N-acetyltransferase [Mycolicibacterium sp. BiH015]MDA2891279.1 GNAT family N-acetyltransferase [Mycolicibacterium sp. BiH015]